MREREKKVTPTRDPARQGGISAEVDEWLRERSAAFQRGTQRRGMPDTYGKGKDRLSVPPPPGPE